MKKVFFIVAMGTALLSSCGTARKSVNLNGEWNIVNVDGQKVVSDQDPFIGFDINEGRIYGNAGCNNIMGSVSVNSKKGTLELSNVGATRKMCRDMKLEDEVLAALGKVACFDVKDNQLVLRDAQGNLLFGLERKDASLVDINGEWIISAVGEKKVEKIQKTPYILIDTESGKIHGTGGCNILNASLLQEGNNPASIRFENIATTKMAGPGMEQESVILKALETVRAFVIRQDGTLSLLDENQKEVVVLSKNKGKTLSK